MQSIPPYSSSNASVEGVVGLADTAYLFLQNVLYDFNTATNVANQNTLALPSLQVLHGA